MESKHDNAIQPINRALDIVEVLATQKDGLGITAIASKTELSKSTAHRIAAMPVERGYIEHEAVSGGYRLGLKYIEIASYYINSLELQTEARPFLWELTSQLGLTAHLGILDAHEVIYVEKLDVFPGVRLYSQIGFRVPAYYIYIVRRWRFLSIFVSRLTEYSFRLVERKLGHTQIGR